MATLASGRIGARRWEVRESGGTRRLWLGGVLHTQWNPGRPLTGSIWDPFAFAALLARRPVGSVLMLGLGGGAAVHLLRRHVRPRRIVAIENDAGVARIARRWFDVAGDDLTIVVGHAEEWLRSHRARFDLVVDDVYGELAGEPERSESGARWWRLLASHVAPGGVLVVNAADPSGPAHARLVESGWSRRRFPAALRFSYAKYANAIVALGPEPCSARELRRRIETAPTLRGGAARRLMTFRLTDLRRSGHFTTGHGMALPRRARRARTGVRTLAEETKT